MDKTILVEKDIEEGRKLLSTLDAADIPIVAAYWLYELERNRWRLIFATPLVETVGSTPVYRRIRELVQAGSEGGGAFDDVIVVSPRDRIAGALHRVPGSDRVTEFRLTDGVVNGLSVDDAYVYRTRPLPVPAEA